MAIERTIPDLISNPSGIVGSEFAAAVKTEVEGLWARGNAWVTSVAGANTITGNVDPELFVSSRALGLYLIPAAANTGAVTINLDGNGAEAIVDLTGSALLGGELVAGKLYKLIFDGTSWRLFSGDRQVSNTGVPGLIVEDQKAAGTSGGSITANIDTIRDLNTVVRNEIAGASLASNKITLPAGSYYVEWSAPGNSTVAFKSSLWNDTDSQYEAHSSTSWTGGTNALQQSFGISLGVAELTLAASKDFEIHQRATQTFGTGLGSAVDIASRIEVYTRVKVWTL